MIDCMMCGKWFKPKNKELSNYHICPECDKHYDDMKENFKNPEYIKRHNQALKKAANE